MAAAAVSSSTPEPSSTMSSSSTLTLEMMQQIQQMIVSVLSTFGFQVGNIVDHDYKALDVDGLKVTDGSRMIHSP
ncbi:hypothetical protein SADUNF_Sadunf12G0106200 [Salix dunnii]|uniref:Uncharacterized protein n=1 Tax=Salix dunnii TaxID=1413687 RepID=A0A835MNG1_9ROSI|nr:hypothetical protein SADUNF_Sadunf12G0106200 [Salix dunnii]